MVCRLAATLGVRGSAAVLMLLLAVSTGVNSHSRCSGQTISLFAGSPFWSGPAHEAPASIKTPGDAEDGVAILVHRRTEPFIGRPMILVSAVAQGAGESKCSVSSSAPPRTEWPVALRRHRAGRRRTPRPFRHLLVSATLLTPNPSFQRTAFGSR